MLSFEKQIAKEIKEFGRDAERVIEKVALGAWDTAVDATPSPPSDPPPAYQRTGRLSNGWKLGTRKSGLIPAVGQYPDATTRRPDFRFDFGKDRELRLYNNIPYAYFVNHGVGPGGRTPRLMLEKATKHFEDNITVEFKKLRK